MIFEARLNYNLDKSKKIIHVGANEGQERWKYQNWDVGVLWFEAEPEIFRALQIHLEGFGRQKPFKKLVTDKDYKSYQFNVASNFSNSSSIYDFGINTNYHQQDVEIEKIIEMESITLDTFLDIQELPYESIDGLVLDTQGSELDILKGSRKLLSSLSFVCLEASDLEMYENSPSLTEIIKYLEKGEFVEYCRDVHFQHKGKDYCDVLFERKTKR